MKRTMKRTKKHPTLVIAIICAALSIASNSQAKDDVIEEVVSVGVQPGPQLWRITKDDHELWVFGTLSPVPRNMDWDSASVEAILADAQEVIDAPGLAVSANPFSTALALPLLWGIENNPDKQKLEDIVPAELYARWLTLKAQYIGRDRGIERHRPLFAANELFSKAIEESGLEHEHKITKQIERLIKRYDVPITTTTITRHLDKPRQRIRAFKRAPIDDLECFRQTIARLETDLPAMRSRAAAWAVGDITTLRALPHQDQNSACYNAVLTSSYGEELAEESGLIDLEAQLAQRWIDAAEQALSKNTVTFATLPIAELLKPDGYLNHFISNGYAVRGG